MYITKNLKLNYKYPLMNTIVNYVFLVFLFSFISCDIQEKTQVETKSTDAIVIGVFDGSGAGAISVVETIEALKIDKKISAFPISASDIMQGKLKEIHALVFPGGSGSKQLNNLGKKGKEAVLDFVKKDGKGVLGICAGAYMLCSTEGYVSLQLGDVKHIDRAHYARGRGLVEFKLNNKALEIFPELEGNNQFVQYYDGPVMQALATNNDYTELGQYVTDIHPNKGIPEGITPGNTFIYNEKVGNGKIFAVAGHPESTPGMRWMIPRMARWITNNELVSYDVKWIDPNRYSEPILYDSDRKKFEKKTWWLLFDEDAPTQINAMDTLYLIRSRPAVRWNIGLLRDTNPETRAHAAKLLAKAEYTDAIKDLKVSLKVEENKEVNEAFQKAIEFLEK